MDEGILVIDLDAHFAGYESVNEWYFGERDDHIYRTCPALTRSRPPINRGQGRLYPEAGDVCGWCVRVWRARKAKSDSQSPTLEPEVSALSEQETG
ncbi:hypothetical protein [Nonomuraea basaltis]|uniref:hypothetical protein n=1 Tax=Nonomuraea basaltis TaxID=2495887 RepID=UPI00110C6BE7|nr:hypothetical protein [Nonomuraea basaltis]TMS00156.1 hypothetical protein EJK15_03530 [Nonomuraea basaltis]